MIETQPQLYTAFDGHALLSQGPLDRVVLRVKKKLKEAPSSSILVFSDTTGKQMDFDLSGTEREVLQRLHVFIAKEQPSPVSEGPGRPKLGVVSREISLLPRHWEWLSTQTGGASATLRRLIDEAKKNSAGRDLVKQAQERTYKFLSSIAGNLPHYEEALRALFGRDQKKFESLMAPWPKDIREYARSLAETKN